MSLVYGQSKPPDVNDFLHDFVQELSELLQGLSINGTKIAPRVGAFICDAPAKSFILCIKSHNGYYSCTKCTVRGTYINNRVCFPDLTASLRTDVDFQSVPQEEHHLDTGPSILLELPVDIVKQVPLEYMHLVCLGVVHKLLVMWFRGPQAMFHAHGSVHLADDVRSLGLLDA